VLHVLSNGVASPAHSAFVQRLQQAKAKSSVP
jgi:hypothetical protein